MKYLLILSSLFVLVSCNSKSSSKSRSCTYNNEPIDCAYMDSMNEGSETVPRRSNSLIAEIKTRIILFSNRFEMTTREHNLKKETFNGQVQFCETQVSASDIFWFYFNDNDLVLRLNNGQETQRYKRVGEETNGIHGMWRSTDKFDGQHVVTTLTFTESNLTISAECKFN